MRKNHISCSIIEHDELPFWRAEVKRLRKVLRDVMRHTPASSVFNVLGEELALSSKRQDKYVKRGKK